MLKPKSSSTNMLIMSSFIATIIVMVVWGACIYRYGSVRAGIAALQGYPIAIDNRIPLIQMRGPSTKTLNIEFRNLLREPISVIGADPDCSCVQVIGLPMTIQPHEKVSLRIDITSNEKMAGTTRRFVLFHLDKNSPPVRVPLTIEVLSSEN